MSFDKNTILIETVMAVVNNSKNLAVIGREIIYLSN